MNKTRYEISMWSCLILANINQTNGMVFYWIGLAAVIFISNLIFKNKTKNK